MKKAGLIFLCTAILAGCADTDEKTPAETDTVPVSGDAYTLFTDEFTGLKTPSSLSYSVTCKYSFKYSDDTLSLYMMDGVLESAESGDMSHLTQHILANGLNSSMEAYFYDGTLYNTYNGISYYEKMSADDVKQVMLVPLSPYQFPEALIGSIDAKTNSEGNRIYTIEVAESSRKDFFHDRYDFYGVSEFDGAEIKEGTVTETFSADGVWIGEKAEFVTSFVYQDQPIDTSYTSEVKCFSLDETSVSVSDDMKKEQAAWPAFEDIDTSTITDEPAIDDSPEETVSATFRKRLINRLGYNELDENTVQMIYNTNEAYTVDFENKTFTYSNYSINYVYSWQGDMISMGACTYDFGKDMESSECQESTVDQMKEVKNYLMMELYYCGLSLEDLQAENR